VNAPSANGSTALHWACGAGSESAVATLLECGADPLARTYTWRRQVFGKGSGHTPLHWAAESDQSRIVELLADACPQAVVSVDERGLTPLDVAEKELALSSFGALERAEQHEWVCLRLRIESSAHGMLAASAAAAARPALHEDTDGADGAGHRRREVEAIEEEEKEEEKNTGHHR
jgi:ankyrin repeat protein